MNTQMQDQTEDLIRLFFSHSQKANEPIKYIIQRFVNDDKAYSFNFVIPENNFNLKSKLDNYVNNLNIKTSFVNSEEFIENATPTEYIKYKNVFNKNYKIEKIKSSELVKGYNIYVERSSLITSIVKNIPTNLKKLVNSYYVVNDYIEIKISDYHDSSFIVSINIKNKTDFTNVSNFTDLFTHIFNIYCIINNMSNAISNGLRENLLLYFNEYISLKPREKLLTLGKILSGKLLGRKLCFNYDVDEEYKLEPEDYVKPYQIKETRQFLGITMSPNHSIMLYCQSFKLIFVLRLETKDIDIIALDKLNLWFFGNMEMLILSELENKYNCVFTGFINYKTDNIVKNVIRIYDVYKLENLNLIDRVYIERYNYIKTLMTILPITSEWNVMPEDLLMYKSADKIIKDFKYMISTRSMGLRYMSNDVMPHQKIYNWIAYQNFTFHVKIVSGVPYLKHVNDFIDMQRYMKLTNTNENINGYFICRYLNQRDLDNNKRLFKIENAINITDDNIDTTQHYNNFKQYFDYEYDPLMIVKNNSFNIDECVLYKLKHELKADFVKPGRKIESDMPIFNNVEQLEDYVNKNKNSGKLAGLIYIDQWALDFNKFKNIDNDLTKIKICKPINILNILQNPNIELNTSINFDNYLNFHCINNLNDVIAVIIFSITNKREYNMSYSKSQDKFSVDELRRFIKHHNIKTLDNRQIGSLKRSELEALIIDNNMQLADIKKFIENDKQKNKKPEECENTEIDCDIQDGSNYYNYMYTDLEMEYYRKYVRQCTNQLKATALKRHLIEPDTDIDRKNLICILVKKQCKNDSKPKTSLKKQKSRITNIYPENQFKNIDDKLFSNEKSLLCKGYSLFSDEECKMLLMKCDNYDVAEFLFLVCDGFTQIGNLEKDTIIRSFKNNVKMCLDNNMILNIVNNKIINITNDMKRYLQEIFKPYEGDLLEIYTMSLLDNSNVVNLMIFYSLFMSIGLNIYEVTDCKYKLIFSSEYLINSKLFSNINSSIPFYNVIIRLNKDGSKYDFYYHIKKENSDIVFYRTLYN